LGRDEIVLSFLAALLYAPTATLFFKIYKRSLTCRSECVTLQTWCQLWDMVRISVLYPDNTPLKGQVIFTTWGTCWTEVGNCNLNLQGL